MYKLFWRSFDKAKGTWLEVESEAACINKNDGYMDNGPNHPRAFTTKGLFAGVDNWYCMLASVEVRSSVDNDFKSLESDSELPLDSSSGPGQQEIAADHFP